MKSPDEAAYSDVLTAARTYLKHGWAVIPIERQGKRPVVAWQAFQHRHPTHGEIEHWFHASRDLNIGIVTGNLSRLVVIDVDTHHGGGQSLARLESVHGPLLVTVEAHTGGGGRHLYFTHPGGLVRNRAGIVPGVDLRGDSGCVVAPPSLHASGRRYTWAPARAPNEVPLAAMPEWFARLVRPAASRGGHPLTHWRTLVREGVDEGERNAQFASLCGRLFWHGVDVEVALELLLAWNRMRCRPPLADAEVAAVVASIARLHERDEAQT